MAGSVLLLVAIIALAAEGGHLQHPGDDGARSTRPSSRCWVFGAFFLSFAIKVPMFPFHTWLPAAHVEAPTAGSVLLASVLLKMGTYGFLRFSLPITPYAARLFAPYVIWLSVVAIVYGGLAALAQTDLKKLVAYSSVAHMGFATLGIFRLNQGRHRGRDAGDDQPRRHHRRAVHRGGHDLRAPAHPRPGRRRPAWASACRCSRRSSACSRLSSMAFPGTNSFIGEFLVMAGGFTVSKVLVLCTVPGIVAAAAYNLRMLQKRGLRRNGEPGSLGLQDLGSARSSRSSPLLVLVLWIGLHPAPFIEPHARQRGTTCCNRPPRPR